MTYRTLPFLILYIGIALLLPSAGNAAEPMPEAVPEESAVSGPRIVIPEEIPDSELRTLEEEHRASNVVFLPGIKGSRLYDGDGNKLWEPFGNHDVEALMLDQDGKSLRDDVHSEPGDIVDTVAVFTDIYGSYMDFMDGLVEDGTINAWAPIAYDWRLSLPDIVNAGEGSGPIPLSFSSYGLPPIREVLENLSQNSETGKVTIIAHSNGGLVAKQLMLTLGDEETARLIDKVIFVGVPQSGAPQALGALLYGYKEGLPWWFPGIVSTATAREFAENSPMGYHLLPSSAYFRDVDGAHAVARFDAEHSYAEERGAYGSVIDTVSELASFALAKDGGREKPHPGKYWDANVLNENLLAYAQSAHEEIDGWTPPPGVSVYQIAGWGEDTVAGIEYYERCVLSVCAEMYRPTFIEDGDGVVPVPSALMMPTEGRTASFWFDLMKYNDASPIDKDHGTLLAANEMQSHLEKLLSDSDAATSEYISSSVSVPEAENRFRFFLHSPLTLEIRDASGNGIEEIPGATYGEFGDVKYISAPAGPEYGIELHGYDSGTFTLEIQKLIGDEEVMEVAFVGLTSTPETIARIDIGDGAEPVGSLILDIDGDGSPDQIISPEAGGVIESERNDSPKKTGHEKRASRIHGTPTIEALMLKLRILLERLLLQLEMEARQRSGI
jgi:pimeloyl-ACP methyl ester carboxylesterase